jgi:hypothetical protein
MSEDWYIDHYVPKLVKVIKDNISKFEHLDEIIVASYNPL